MKLPLRKNLTPLVEAAEIRIDQQAERTRLKYLTAGSGQALVYEAKRQEALAFINGTPIEDLPHLAAEAQLRGISAHDQARLYLDTNVAWTDRSVAIEMARLDGKMKIRLCATPRQIDDAVLQALSLLEAM